jgi:predicted nucleotidyltransferase
MDIIRNRYNEIAATYGEDNLLGIFLYGSQNYGISTETSDVDTKAIIIPTFEDLCLRAPVSKELHYDDGSHCEVKDIRELVKMFKGQNINFLEIMYTDYCLINPKYNRLWKELIVNNREKIAGMDRRKAIMSMTGQAIHTLKQDNKNGKKFANALRLHYFLATYLTGESYGNCLDVSFLAPQIAEMLIDYKVGKIEVEDAETATLMQGLVSLQSKADLYPKQPDSEASRILDTAIVEFIKSNVKFD